MGHAMRAPTRRERQREADLHEIVRGLPGAAGRGRRAVAAGGRRADGADRAGALPLRRELPGAGRPGRVRDRQGGDRADGRGRLGDPRRRPRGPAGGLRGDVPSLGARAARASSRWSSPTRSPTPRACAASCSPPPRPATTSPTCCSQIWDQNPFPHPELSELDPQVARGARGPADPDRHREGPRRPPRHALGVHAGPGRRSTAWSRSRCSGTWTRGSSRAARCSPR